MQVAARAQGAYFIDQALRQHGVEALFDARVRGAVRGFQADGQVAVGVLVRLALRAQQQRGHGLAGQTADFQRALDPLAVVGRQPRGGDGVQRGQFGMQRRPAFAGGARFQLGAQRRVGLRQVVQPVAQRL